MVYILINLQVGESIFYLFIIKIWHFCMAEWWTELSGSYGTQRWTHITGFWCE